MSTVNNTVWEEDHSTTGKPGKPSQPTPFSSVIYCLQSRIFSFSKRDTGRANAPLKTISTNRTSRSTACTWQTKARAAALKLIHQKSINLSAWGYKSFPQILWVSMWMRSRKRRLILITAGFLSNWLFFIQYNYNLYYNKLHYFYRLTIKFIPFRAERYLPLRNRCE